MALIGVRARIQTAGKKPAGREGRESVKTRVPRDREGETTRDEIPTCPRIWTEGGQLGGREAGVGVVEVDRSVGTGRKGDGFFQYKVKMAGFWEERRSEAAVPRSAGGTTHGSP